jgi:hypothetical protein
MKVRRWLLDNFFAVHSFLVQTLGVHAQMRPNSASAISRRPDFRQTTAFVLRTQRRMVKSSYSEPITLVYNLPLAIMHRENLTAHLLSP